MNKNNIVIIIKNSLEDYYELLDQSNDSYSKYFIDITELSSTLDKIDNNIIKEKLLLIVDKDYLDNNALNSIIQDFSKKMKFYYPYFLYLSKRSISKIDQTIIERGENYFFIIPTPDQVKIVKENLHGFIRFIFQKLLTTERLNYYIVDSFQTIIDSEMINKQKKEIEKLNQEISEMSKVDFLTKLLNRKTFLETLEAEKKRTIRDNWRLSSENFTDKTITNNYNNSPKGKLLDHFGNFACLIFDINSFSDLNRNFGQTTGDLILKEIGEILIHKNIFRENDIIARYDKDQFIVILPETNSKDAIFPAERLNKFISNYNFKKEDNETVHISVSIGISNFSINDKSNSELIERTMEALNYAKKHNGQQIIVYEEVF